MTDHPTPASAVLDVGNCEPDHAAISQMLRQHFNVDIDRVMHVDEALENMRGRPYDLVLVNRLIFADGSPGMDLIKRAKADAALRHVPIMMISNFPEAQQAAVQQGAVPGFGKAALANPETPKRLADYLRASRG